jgi:hypothetical protein
VYPTIAIQIGGALAFGEIGIGIGLCNDNKRKYDRANSEAHVDYEVVMRK